MEKELTQIQIAIQHFLEVIYDFSFKLLFAIIVLVIGILTIRIVKHFIRKITEKRNIDPTVSGFLLSVITWLLRILLFIVFVSTLGVQTSSFIAILGTIGLAIGLSLQGSLSNFTGGLLIIFFKPFRVGDYIQAQNVEGTVKQIQIFNTQINNDNNQAIFIPNGILSNGTVINFSREKNRRANIRINVSIHNDLTKINKIFLDILKNNNKVLSRPAPSVAISEINGDNVVFSVRPWALRTNFSTMNTEILLALKESIDKEKIKLPRHNIEITSKD